jgi:hypothetical protein
MAKPAYNPARLDAPEWDRGMGGWPRHAERGCRGLIQLGRVSCLCSGCGARWQRQDGRRHWRQEEGNDAATTGE